MFYLYQSKIIVKALKNGTDDLGHCTFLHTFIIDSLINSSLFQDLQKRFTHPNKVNK